MELPRMLTALLISGTALVAPAAAQETDPTSGEAPLTLPVGVPHLSREVVLPGSLLEVKPTALETSIIVRIDSVSPHGTALRYDLEFYGLDPGDYNLTDFLRRADGSATGDLPDIPVRVSSSLPAGQIRPHPVRSGPLPALGGYRNFLWLFGGGWLLGAFLLWRGSRAGPHAETLATASRQPTLAERLLPQVAAARAGTLSGAQRAELELMLIAFWRHRLDLGELPAAQALERLKADAHAGPLLGQLELWLHSPGAAPEVDLAELLEPYGELPAGAQAETLPA
ncbi:MAG: hypothetical protein CMK00_08000 [Planctomycetes bacterium]|nr:hypothetical protein [Planctomycetota bacterium]